MSNSATGGTVYKLVEELYANYGKYVNEFRAFPYILDGAKLVERRLLYSLYELARPKLMKSATIIGHTIGHYHPHGDLSTYSSLVGMVGNGFATGQGNWGVNVGVTNEPAAAYRYTEVRAKKAIIDMAFEYIADVPHKAIELTYPEPMFMPTRFPFCLLPSSTYCTGVGFGYRTLIPAYKKEDLMKRLRWILDGKKGKGPVIKPITTCTLDSSAEEYLELLTTGKGRIKYKGVVKKEDSKTVLVTAIPPGKTFTGILKTFDKEISQTKALGWQDESKTTTRVRFKIMKPRQLKIEGLLKKMNRATTSTVTFECNMCNVQGKVTLVSVDQMLFNIYKVYKKVVKVWLNKTIKAIDDHIEELILIGKIKPLLSIQLKQNPDDVDKAIEVISTKLEQSINRIKSIFEKYNIRRIFKIKTDIIGLQNDKMVWQTKLANLDTFVWDKYLNKRTSK